MSIVILAGIAGGHQHAQLDLTTVDNVRAALQTGGTDTEQNVIVAALITRASRALERWAGREFAPRPDPESRVFTYNGSGLLILSPYDLRAVTGIVDYTDQPAATQVTLATTDYLLEPAVTADGTYQMITLPNAGSTGRRMTVTGLWGMPAVPDDVEMACIITVGEWLRAVSGQPRPFNVDAPIERPVSIPYAAQDLLSPYRVPSIA